MICLVNSLSKIRLYNNLYNPTSSGEIKKNYISRICYKNITFFNEMHYFIGETTNMRGESTNR